MGFVLYQIRSHVQLIAPHTDHCMKNGAIMVKNGAILNLCCFCHFPCISIGCISFNIYLDGNDYLVNQGGGISVVTVL